MLILLENCIKILSVIYPQETWVDIKKQSCKLWHMSTIVEESVVLKCGCWGAGDIWSLKMCRMCMDYWDFGLPEYWRSNGHTNASGSDVYQKVQVSRTMQMFEDVLDTPRMKSCPRLNRQCQTKQKQKYSAVCHDCVIKKTRSVLRPKPAM